MRRNSGNMVGKATKEKPSFSRIYRPADLYLNGECTDANGYYIEQNSLLFVACAR